MTSTTAVVGVGTNSQLGGDMMAKYPRSKRKTYQIERVVGSSKFNYKVVCFVPRWNFKTAYVKDCNYFVTKREAKKYIAEHLKTIENRGW